MAQAPSKSGRCPCFPRQGILGRDPAGAAETRHQGSAAAGRTRIVRVWLASCQLAHTASLRQLLPATCPLYTQCSI